MSALLRAQMERWLNRLDFRAGPPDPRQLVGLERVHATSVTMRWLGCRGGVLALAADQRGGCSC